MPQYLVNEQLYRALQHRYGTVVVSNPGIEPSRQLLATGNGARYRYRYRGGEQLRVNCPYCGDDTKHHLWFSCYWGVPSDEFPEDGRRTSLVHCFRCNALEDPWTREQLYMQLYGPQALRGQPATPLNPGVRAVLNGPVVLPGFVVGLPELPPGHPARRFLEDKGFDIAELTARYGVGVCVQPAPDMPAANGRIIIPVHMAQQLVGWQGRYVGDYDWKQVSWTKYYNQRGFAKTLYLYNYDESAQFAATVVVEGASKVWRFGGGPCVATFGASLSPQQAELLAKITPGPLVWLWDGDSWEVSPRGQPPKTPSAIAMLSQYIPLERIVPVRLRVGVKPTSYRTAEIRQLVAAELSRRGWTGALEQRVDVDLPVQPVRRVLPHVSA